MPIFLLPLLLKLAPVTAFLKRVPQWVWIALAVAAAIVAGTIWHHHKAHAAIAAAYQQGKTDEAAHIEAAARGLKQKIDALTGKISHEIRSRNNETNRIIARDAGDKRLRGPGKAICPGGPRFPAAAGRPIAAGDLADAAGPHLPADDRAAVPWGWLVDRAEQCDLDRAEVLSWREWHAKQSAAWAKLLEPPKPR